MIYNIVKSLNRLFWVFTLKKGVKKDENSNYKHDKK